MKTKLHYLLGLTVLLAACQDDEISSDTDLMFDDNTAVIATGDMENLRLSQMPGEIQFDASMAEDEIRIEADESLEDKIRVNVEGGELRITGNSNLPENIQPAFFLHPETFVRLVVEGDRKVTILGTPVLDYLEIVTEGSSELILAGLQVRNLVTRREGESKMYLSSQLADYAFDSVYFPFASVKLYDDFHLSYTEDEVDYLLMAEEIVVRNDSVFALAHQAPLVSYFLLNSHELRNQGNSVLEAFQLPTLQINSRSEGESVAEVWVIDQLTTELKGESVMYYTGPAVVDEYIEGGASLVYVD